MMDCSPKICLLERQGQVPGSCLKPRLPRAGSKDKQKAANAEKGKVTTYNMSQNAKFSEPQSKTFQQKVCSEKYNNA